MRVSGSPRCYISHRRIRFRLPQRLLCSSGMPAIEFACYVKATRVRQCCRGDRGCSLERQKGDTNEDAYSAAKLALLKTKVSSSSRIPGSCRPASFTEHSLRVLCLAQTTMRA
ncbi:hypothetical protein ALC57_06966 [Trachymyrmex cornetzi]|uniref:Uncharacterized protein n=1 Tax=Trachymyrmex cornetzi TaxID=471704 RepID=A0A195E735_9HYME|nr:hypothetical protein ALC57_06966 [Trachymyrmex cornetzi]